MPTDVTISWTAPPSLAPGLLAAATVLRVLAAAAAALLMPETGTPGRRLLAELVGAGTGRLLGMQLVGHKDGAVAKRVDIAAAALFSGLTVDQLSDLDLAYTPPLGSPWDAVQMAAQRWSVRSG